MVAIRVESGVEMPFRERRGCCPRCGIAVRPRTTDVFCIGNWSGRNETTGERTGGQVFGVNCAECGTVLKNYRFASWGGVDLASVRWHSDGEAVLLGGDRWRGRPGAWSADHAPRFEPRLRELVSGLGSLEEAIRVLHLTSGLGALPLSELVERLAGVPSRAAKRLVVGALHPDLAEKDSRPPGSLAARDDGPS